MHLAPQQASRYSDIVAILLAHQQSCFEGMHVVQTAFALLRLGGGGGGGYCYFLRSDLSTTVTGTFQCLSLGLVEMNSDI